MKVLFAIEGPSCIEVEKCWEELRKRGFRWNSGGRDFYYNGRDHNRFHETKPFAISLFDNLRVMHYFPLNNNIHPPFIFSVEEFLEDPSYCFFLGELNS